MNDLYKVVIPCKYHRPQLDELVAWVSEKFHAEKNRTRSETIQAFIDNLGGAA